MFKNYFKTAFRNLWRHRVFSFINIMGLAVGLTACFLIFLYVRFELSYENFNSKSNRIYRVVADLKTPSEVIPANGPAWAVGPHIVHDFPEIESMVRVSWASLLVRKDDIKFQEKSTLWADSSFFKVFDNKLLRGDRNKVLSAPFSIVFSQSAAKKYFGNEDPIGRTLLLTGEGKTATVTGVMEDMPENCMIRAEMLVSMSTLTGVFNKRLDDQWFNYGNSTYLLLKPNTNAEALQKKFPAFLEKHSGDDMRKMQMYATLILEPLREIYLHSTRDESKSGNMNNVYIFSMIAAFILLIACINFINLTTARSTERAKEVGIRKVVGALKNQLALQFIGESMIICFIAFLLTLLCAVLLLPLFNQVAGKIVSKGIFTDFNSILIFLGISLGLGLLAGIYPAMVLSSFRPVTVLKGRFATGTRGIFLRKGLVVTQFAISIALIIGTIIVYRQMLYMRNQNLGFDKEQLLVVESNGDPARFAFQESVKSIPNVLSTAAASSVPGGGNPGAYSEVENKKGELQVANLDLYFVDYDYLPQLKIQMAAGRAFSRDFGSDTTHAMIINEATAKLLGYSTPQEAIGRRFKQWGREGTIVGVMKDFHFRSLQQQIKPLSMRIEPDGCELITVKVGTKNLSGTIDAIEKKWKALVPNRPFSYYFLDDSFDKQYRAEDRFGKLFLNFAILAIFISCLGLLGLASYSTMQRTREIGIRKVMGASVSGIVQLLSKDFLKLVVFAFVIATPIAWLVMSKWVQDFAYRAQLSWWIFVLAGVTALIIAIFTISFLAIRAAIANPVDSLRSE